MYKKTSFSELKGEILKSIEVSEEEITFSLVNGKIYRMYHEEDCCESVTIEDIVGIPIDDLIGDPILVAEERTSVENPLHESHDSFTWTFYELATIKGAVTIRWYGTSNGYYSERVSFVEEVNNA